MNWQMVKSWIQFMGCLRMAGSIITFLLLVEAFVFEERPVMLIMDGHSSHYTPEAPRGVVKRWLCFLHSTQHNSHHSAPWCESFLKRQWSSVYHAYLTNNPGSVVTSFSSIHCCHKFGINQFNLRRLYPASRRLESAHSTKVLWE